METPYSSQVSLPPSTSNSTSPSASSSSASSCLASVNPSYDSTNDELRHSRKRTASEDEVERKEGESSVEDFEGSGHEGRSARPRAMLRRSRTVQQVERSQIATLRARRASTALTEQEWSTNAGCEERLSSEEESAEEQRMVKRTKMSEVTAIEEVQAREEGIAPVQKLLSPTSSFVDDSSSLIPPPLVPVPSKSKLSTRSGSLPSITLCSSSSSTPSPAQPFNPETSYFPTAVPRAPSPQEHSNPSLRSSPTSTAPPPRRPRANSLPTSSPSSRFQAPFSASTSTSRPMSPRTPEHREQFVKFYDSKEKRARRHRPEPVQASPIPSYRYRHAEQRTPAPRLLSQSELLLAHSSSLASRGFEVKSTLAPTSLVPPISKSTLRELDLHEVLRNAQLRHDVVFDPNLAFRPNFDGEKGERKRVAAEQYWLAVSGEISTGCRCTTFADYTLLPCICTSTSPSSSKSSRIVNPTQLPSRIIALVAELRGILLSLLPAATPVSPTPPSTAVFGSTSSPASPTPPSVSTFSTYGPREQIIEALEPVFVSQQLVQGVLDVAGLARFLGSTLKTHCAPMRDELVDEMVEACEGDGILKGLRMCFEILELMKLDIANHQLRSLRPYLLQTSVEFERRFFEGLNTRQDSDSTIPRSQSWFDSAASAFEKKVDQLPMDSRELADKIVTHGVLDLVFSPQTPSSTPPSPRPELSSFPTLPETFQLDAYRLAHFHCDVTDLTIVYMLTLLYQQLALPARPSPEDLDILRHELWCIISASTGSHCSLVGSSTPNVGIPQGPPGQGYAKLESEVWRQGMQDALLQVAARAQEAKLRDSSSSPPIQGSKLPTPDQKLLSLIDGYFDVNARADSKVFQLLSQRLRETLQAVVDEELSKEKARGDFEFVKWWTTASAPTPMRTGGRRTANGAGAGAVGIDSFTPTASIMASTSPSVITRGTKRSHSEEEEEEANDDSSSVSSDDEGEKRQRTGRSSSISIRQALPHASHVLSPVDLASSRNGLTPLIKEVRMLGERIAKVTSFNLSVYRPLYETLLAARRT